MTQHADVVAVLNLMSHCQAVSSSCQCLTLPHLPLRGIPRHHRQRAAWCCCRSIVPHVALPGSQQFRGNDALSCNTCGCMAYTGSTGWKEHTRECCPGLQVKETSRVGSFKRPQKPIELYEYETCPFCRRVIRPAGPDRAVLSWIQCLVVQHACGVGLCFHG